MSGDIMLIGIVAMDLNRCIGKNGEQPFYLSADLKHFSKTTRDFGATCAGRKTQETIQNRIHGPLPDRENFVLSRSADADTFPGCKIVHDPQEILSMSETKNICIIGGGEIYSLFFPHLEMLIVSHVQMIVEGGDTFFPEINPANWHWQKARDIIHSINDKNQLEFRIAHYLRRHERPLP